MNKQFIISPYSPKLMVIFDLDSTLIGDISILSKQKTFLEKFYNIQMNESDIIIALKNGLLRPYTKKLINLLVKHNILIVVYTMSTKEWATFVINALQKYIGYNFVSGLFTREDCLLPSFPKHAFKRIKYVVHRMQKYGFPVTYPNTILIDDNNVLAKDENSRKIHIVPYNFVSLDTISEYIEIKEIKKNKSAHNYYKKNFIVNYSEIYSKNSKEIRDIEFLSLIDYFLKGISIM